MTDYFTLVFGNNGLLAGVGIIATIILAIYYGERRNRAEKVVVTEAIPGPIKFLIAAPGPKSPTVGLQTYVRTVGLALDGWRGTVEVGDLMEKFTAWKERRLAALIALIGVDVVGVVTTFHRPVTYGYLGAVLALGGFGFYATFRIARLVKVIRLKLKDLGESLRQFQALYEATWGEAMPSG